MEKRPLDVLAELIYEIVADGLRGEYDKSIEKMRALSPLHAAYVYDAASSIIFNFSDLCGVHFRKKLIASLEKSSTTD